jgi:hypothetical protein
MATSLREGDDVEGSVEAPVAAAIEAVTTGGARGSWNRRHATGHGEGRCGAEASRITGLTEKTRRDDRANADDRGQRCVRVPERSFDTSLDLTGLGHDRLQARQSQTGDLGRYSGRATEQAPGGPLTGPHSSVHFLC